MSLSENTTTKPASDSDPDSSGFFDSRPAESADIGNCMAVFLGRKPDRELLDRWCGESILAVLRALLETEDFQSKVLSPVLLREPLPHALLEDAPSLRLIDWAQRRLPIEAGTRLALGGARTWTHLLETLLADQTLLSLSEGLADAGIDTALRERLEKEPFAKVRRSVVGSLDSASAFEIRGWAADLCDKSVPVVLEFFAENAFIGSVRCDAFRADVQDVVGGNGKSGFTFQIASAHRAYFAGGRTLTAFDSVSKQQVGVPILVHADPSRYWDLIAETRTEIAGIRKLLERIEARLPEIGRQASIPIEAYSEYWERFYRLSRDVLDEQRIRSRQFAYRPLISVVIPTWNSDTRFLDQAIASVRAQSYEHWELILSDDGSDRDELRSLLSRYSSEPRIRCLEAADREGIAANTNRALAATGGEYIAFLDHDDELSSDALFCNVAQLQERRYGLLYSDEDRIESDERGGLVHHTPFFKPGFDPDLLLSINYMCHLVVMRRDLVTSLGGLRSGYEGAQDHDLLLRAVELLPPTEILLLPRVLYHWRVTQGSVSGSPHHVEQIQQKVVAAVDEGLKRRGTTAKAESHNDPVGSARLFATRVRWCLPSNPPKLSIIIATRDRMDLLRPCLESVLASTVRYPGCSEVLIADNDSIESATLNYFAGLAAHGSIRIVPFRGPFNWSAINNKAAREATGEVLIFLNNDTLVLTHDWCEELVAHALRPDVGAVGARLLYADGTIQHAGVLLGVEGVAGHECVGDSATTGGYFGRSQLLRSASAVTGACLATRRTLFQEMEGGFDELNLKVAFNDVDYCMKLRKAGYRVVYNPFAVLYHLESKSRGRDVTATQATRHQTEAIAFRARWSEEEMIDPYYNAHFERFSRPFDRLLPPPDLSRPLGNHAFSNSRHLALDERNPENPA